MNLIIRIILLFVFVSVDSSLGQTTTDGRISRCEYSSHHLENMIHETISRTGFDAVQQSIPHVEVLLQSLMNITAAQEQREIQHRQDIEKLREDMREQNREIMANCTAAATHEITESRHSQDIANLRKDMLEQNRVVIANITAAQDMKESRHRHEIENYTKYLRAHNEGLMANITGTLEVNEMEKRRNMDDVLGNITEQHRDLMAEFTTVLESKEKEHRKQIQELRELFRSNQIMMKRNSVALERMATERRQQIINLKEILEAQETDRRQDMDRVIEQIRDVQSKMTTEIEKKGSEQTERLRTISATAEKDVQSLKLIGSAGSSTLILRNDVAGSDSYFFNRSWVQYEEEFGSPTSHYWIGLNRLHEVSQRNCKIHFDFQLLNGSLHFAQYSNFSVGSPSINYTLRIGEYSGDLYDALAIHDGHQFSTYDANNDWYYRMGWATSNCASDHGGGFWFNHCTNAFITTSPANRYFRWYLFQLYSVEVRMLC